MPKDDLTVSLHDHLIKLLEDHERLQDAELAAMEKALVLARGEAEKQYQALNNLRHEYQEERKQFLDKGVYEARHSIVETKIANLHGEIDSKMGSVHRALDEQNNNVKTWGKLAVVGIALLQLALHFWK